MRYVVDMGSLYRISDAKYKKYLQLVAAEKGTEASELLDSTSYIGGVRDVTEMRSDQAAMELETLEFINKVTKKKKKG